LVRKSAEYNIATNQEETFPVMGPMPVDNVTGYAVAVNVLLASRETGRYHADHKQEYETIRKHRLVFSNLWNASARGEAVNISIGKDTRGQSLLLSACPTDSE
jgi:hypothetical protein